MTKYNIEDCFNVAYENKGRCLSKQYKNNTTKMLWQCRFGHTWRATFNNVKNNNTWCPHCDGQTIDGLKIANEIAKIKGGRCLSKKYKNISFKMKWACSKNHIWTASLNNIKNKGSWCPTCEYNKKSIKNRDKNGLEVAKNIALGNNGFCLSDEYINSKTNLLWKCSAGHTWSAPLTNIKYNKSWCRMCGIQSAANKRKSDGLRIAKSIAKSMNGRCLSITYLSKNNKLEWECKFKHTWHATLNNVLVNKSWCPKCRLSKGERAIVEILKKIIPKYNIETNYSKFDWLKNCRNKRKQKIDIYVPELKLAIEYDGEQHFKPIKAFGGRDQLKQTKRLDRLKDKKIKQHPNDVKYFIRFNYKNKINEQFVANKLLNIGIII